MTAYIKDVPRRPPFCILRYVYYLQPPFNSPILIKTMKLIVAGASGFVATEVIRQSLSMPQINSVIALARHPVSVPLDLGQSADASKLHSVVLDNYGSYTEDVMKQLADADACIWYVN